MDVSIVLTSLIIEYVPLFPRCFKKTHNLMDVATSVTIRNEDPNGFYDPDGFSSELGFTSTDSVNDGDLNDFCEFESDSAIYWVLYSGSLYSLIASCCFNLCINSSNSRFMFNVCITRCFHICSFLSSFDPSELMIFSNTNLRD